MGSLQALDAALLRTAAVQRAAAASDTKKAHRIVGFQGPADRDDLKLFCCRYFQAWCSDRVVRGLSPGGQSLLDLGFGLRVLSGLSLNRTGAGLQCVQLIADRLVAVLAHVVGLRAAA